MTEREQARKPETMAVPVLTMPQMLREHARHQPSTLAIRQKDFGIWQPITWSGYFERARAFGLGLEALGVTAGGHVGVLSENRAEWVIAQMGAGIIHAVTVGVYPTSPANEVAYVLAHADVDVVVVEDQEQADKVLDCRADLPRLRRIVVVDMRGLKAYDHPDLIPFDEVERLGAERHAAEPERADRLLDAQTLDDTALMIYTSGSTGKPKGAVITWRNIVHVVPGLIARLSLGPAASSLSYLPLCHVAEQAMTNFAPVYLGSLISFGESLRTVQSDLREVAPTFFMGVPRIWEKLHAAIHIKMAETGGWRKALYDRALADGMALAYKPRRQWTLAERLRFQIWYLLVYRALLNFIGLRRTQIALTGAAPISTDILRFFRAIGVPLVEVYGQTETAGVALGQLPEDPRPGTVGTAVDGVEVKLDPTTSEILVRGGSVFAGYYKNEAATRDTIRDGWLHTGDVGEEVDGHIRIVDRIKDIMITAGGKNLSPTEIENAVKSSPYLKECVVIGDRRKFVSALIQIDYDTVARWAEEQGIAYTTFRSLAENPRVRALVEQEVAHANAGLAPVSHVRRFHLLTKELDHDDDEVTATMKIRRSNVYRKYADTIESLYA
ncbi:AMP-binding protein [Tistrella sp. BH-R2-4]|uniref:AMP-binding protein n=1 Tax=Tistrella arctica TaxID=3133430 RepID=A0ABU9YPJ4_9PROT